MLMINGYEFSYGELFQTALRKHCEDEFAHQLYLCIDVIFKYKPTFWKIFCGCCEDSINNNDSITMTHAAYDCALDQLENNCIFYKEHDPLNILFCNMIIDLAENQEDTARELNNTLWYLRNTIKLAKKDEVS